MERSRSSGAGPRWNKRPPHSWRGAAAPVGPETCGEGNLAVKRSVAGRWWEELEVNASGAKTDSDMYIFEYT